MLAREKELTRHRDQVNATRRRLSMVRIDKPYTFAGPDGKVGLLDLLEGLCVPTTSSASCDQPIFVDHATDVSVFSDAVQVEIDWLG